MLLLWILLALVVIIYIANYNWSRRNLYRAALKYEGPLAWPIIGNGLMFYCKNEEILDQISQCVEKFTGPGRIWLGPKLILIFPNPEHIEKILSSQKFAHKHELYDLLKMILGEGMVTASGPRYRNHRRVIQPMFNMKFCEGFIESFQNHVETCMGKLDEFVDKGTFDVHHTLHHCYADIVGDAVLGYKIGAQQGRNMDVVQAFIDIYEVGITRFIRPWLYPDVIYDHTPHKKVEQQLLNVKDEFISEVVIESWKRRKLNNKSHSFNQLPIVDQIGENIENNPDLMTSQDFADHMATLYAASEDTMTIVSSFMCVCLGMYPEYQEKVAEEIRQVIGEKPRAVTLDDISKLSYMDMCIKDVLRLIPIAPYIMRQNLADTHIGEWYVPKGCAVVVPIFNIHRNPKYWENPEHFHPDHFLPEAVKNRHVYAYVPFSAGPRSCIGKIFANIGLKVMLANLFQKYEVYSEGKFPDFKLRMDISVRPMYGHNIKLKKRVWK